MKNNVITQWIIGFVILLSISLGYAASLNEIQWSESSNAQKSNAVAYAFLSSKCPFCHHLQEFLKSYTATNPGYTINYYYIDKDKDALLRFNTFLQAKEQTDFIVPSLYFCNTRWIGFNPAYQEQLIKGLSLCYQQLQMSQELSPETLKTLENWATAYSLSPNTSVGNQFGGSLLVLVFNDLLQSILLMVVLLALLLVYRKSSVFIPIFFTYIVFASITHYFIQTHAASYFKLFEYSHIVSAFVGIGIVCNYFRIRFAQHPLVIILLVGLTAALVMFYSQSNNPNLALVFQNWLKMQNASPLNNSFLHLIYQICYTFLLAVVSGILYKLVIRFKLFKNNELAWQTAGRYGVLLLGFTLIIYPSSVSHQGFLLASVLTVVIAISVRRLICSSNI